MVKSYILAGSLLMTSLLIVGGISFNSADRNFKPNGDHLSGGFIERLFGNPATNRSTSSSSALPNSGSNQSFYRLFAAADSIPQAGNATDKKEADLVPLPYWLLQKLLSEGEVTTSPVPCPVWMLYKLGTARMS